MELTLQEKKQAVTDLEAVREQLKETREEVSVRCFVLHCRSDSMDNTFLLIINLCQ